VAGSLFRLGHHDVAEDDVGLDLGKAPEELSPARDRNHLVLGLGEGEFDHLLDRDAVIG
jgi:hypothetical protein